jgi:hypothetical protein
MPKNMPEFLSMMDECLWFRMIVCFLPSLVIVKLVGYSGDDSFLNKTSTAVLLIGVAVYVFWGRLRGWSAPADAEEVQEAAASECTIGAVAAGDDVPGGQQLDMLAELRGLCQESERESDRLIAMEVAVNPQLSYAEATRSAIARKRILEK